ncbi:hypothetical protein CMV_001734 [Castanea mollissima]|uniref:DUF7803 domain-containing protein n=1 Tax=Castanea mollissima TaxID=60419 RepID=A0A8J4S292_9ROSI|nr:hypothetical protein CMV_001734 [Castanea mollissima]
MVASNDCEGIERIETTPVVWKRVVTRVPEGGIWWRSVEMVVEEMREAKEDLLGWRVRVEIGLERWRPYAMGKARVEKLPSIPPVVTIFARKRFLFSVKQGWRVSTDPVLVSLISEFWQWKDNKKAKMDVDSQPTMEETILVGDDLMMGPPSPLIPPEIASHVLEGVDLCDGILRNLFLCLQINDIEPFCQDEIALYRQCAEKRDKELRQRLQDSEHKLGLSMPLDEAKERAAQLESEVTSLERRLILASGIEGMEGFRQRWSLHGRLTDTKRRLESLKQGMENKIKDEPVGGSTAKRWSFW